jgi:hypothetical protein
MELQAEPNIDHHFVGKFSVNFISKLVLQRHGGQSYPSFLNQVVHLQALVKPLGQKPDQSSKVKYFF